MDDTPASILRHLVRPIEQIADPLAICHPKCGRETPVPDEPLLIRTLTHEQARREQLLYWSRKSIPERLAASAALTKRMNAMRGMKRDTKKQLSIPAEFLRQRVKFAIIGGVAVSAHGYVRATDDLDLFVASTDENITAAYAALGALGLRNRIPITLLKDEPSLRSDPGDDHIDILSSIGDMPFEQVWQNRVEVKIEGLSVPFISKADLLENKRKTGRLRDLADVEALELIPDTDPGAIKES